VASPQTKSAVDIGTVLAETYEVVGLLGRGGMGAVWQANHVRLPGKKVAIKVLHADIADEESLARFRREAEIASRLGHPNIVDVHDFNALPDGTPYLVLEYLSGESLDERISKGPISLDDTFRIIRQISSALQAAHSEHIIHRDLKPQNVFLVPTEAGGYIAEHAKVLDFGISKIRGSATVKTQDSAILGTPQYMAPEQATGAHDDVDPRTDVFALGAMTYEMLCGKPAFEGQTIPEVVFKVVYEEPPNLAEVNPSVTPRVSRAVHKALSKKQDERFADVSEYVKALTGNELTTLRRGSPVVPPPSTEQRLAVASTSASQQGADDAFAQTIGSGDHSAQLAAAGGLAAPVEPSPATTATTAPAVKTGGSKAWLWMLLGLVGIAAAVGITIMVMAGGDEANESGDQIAANDVQGDPARDDGVQPAATIDAGTASLVDPKVDTKEDPKTDTKKDPKTDTKKDPKTDTKRDPKTDTKKDPKTDTKKDPKTDTKKDPKSDTKEDPKTSGVPAEFTALIKKGEQALRGGDAAKAVHLADKAMRVHSGQAAFALRAKAYCLKKDLSNVNANLRRLSAAWKRKVTKYCAKVGMEL
jgi:serine/threonine-protein kinase